MKIKITLLLTLSLIGIAAVTLVSTDSSVTRQAPKVVQDELPADKPITRTQVEYAKKVEPNKVLGFESKLGHLPDSLAGTALDVRLNVDENGHLRISDDLKYVFDFFLSTIDEEDLDTILSRIDEYLNHHLEEPALSESKAILVQYIDFKESLVDLEKQMGEALSGLTKEDLAQGQYLELLRMRLDQRNALRDQYLDPEVNTAFFADEAAYDEYTYSKFKVTSDKSLSEEERYRQLEALKDQLPEDVKESIAQTQITETLKVKTQQLLEQGGSQQEVRELRVEMFGEEAAQRFDELDKQRAEWNTRVESYLAQRQKILSTSGVVREELEAQVDELRASLFDVREQIRVKGIEARSVSS